jgi:hypothetical protein
MSGDSGSAGPLLVVSTHAGLSADHGGADMTYAPDGEYGAS